jgi:hypothetical protein
MERLMLEEQWDAFFQRLLDGTRAAIREFAAKHSTEEVCDFAYDSEPCYGYVLTCFNTTNANFKLVKHLHDSQVAQRKTVLGMPSWRSAAYYQVRSHGVVPYCNNPGYFPYQGFTDIQFPEWEKFAHSDDYPKSERHEDDYLMNRAALILAQALDTLVEDGSFELLKLAHPTRLGFTIHDEPHCIVRILNLPEVEQRLTNRCT